MILCKDVHALLHVISLVDWPKHVKCRSGGCLERFGDRKPTVRVTVATTVTLSYIPNVGNPALLHAALSSLRNHIHFVQLLLERRHLDTEMP